MSERILIVDDDQQLCRTLSDILRLKGYAPLTAETGGEAVQQATALGDGLAVALVDLRLPDMDGLEVAAAVQREAPAAEVIVLTGHASVESAVAALRGETFDYLQKPVQPDLVLATIGRALERRTRKGAEAALRESEERYRAVAQAATDAVITTDVEGRIVLFNAAAEKLFGWSAREMIGQSVTVLEPERFRSAHLAGMERFRATHEPRVIGTTVELVGLKKDGSEFPIELSLSTWQAAGQEYFTAFIRDITERVRMEEQLRQRFDQLQAVYHMTAAVSQAGTIEEIYEEALTGLQRALKTDRAAILLFDPGGVMRFEAWRGLSEDYRKAVEIHSPWSPDARNPRPVLVPRVEEEPTLERLRAVILAEGIRALAFIPLVHQGRLLGKFMTYFDAPHRFGADEVQLAQTIASHIAFAIARKRAEAEIKRRSEELATLLEVSQALATTLDLEAVLQTAVESAARVMELDRAAIYLCEGDWLHLRAAVPREDLSAPETIRQIRSADQPLVQAALTTWQPVAVPDTATAELTPGERAVVEALDLRSVLFVPLLSGERAVGTLHLGVVGEPRAFSGAEIDLARTLANQVALAIENARLYEEASKRADQMAIVHTLGRQITSLLDVDELLQTTAEALQARFGYLSVQLYLLDQDAGELEARGVAEGAGGYRRPIGQGITGRVAELGELALIRDVSREPDFIPCTLGTQSELALPIRIAEEVVGVLNVESAQLNDFDEADVIALQALAGQLGAALEAARLYDQVHRRMAVLRALFDVSSALRGAATVEAMLPIILDQTLEVIGTETGALFLLDKQADQFVVPVARGRMQGMTGLSLPRKGCPTARCLETGQPQMNVKLPARPAMAAALTGEETSIQFALRVGEEAVGVMHICFSEPHDFAQEEIRILTAIADMAASAIRRAQLFEAVQSHAASLEREVAVRTAELQREKEQVEAILLSAADPILIVDTAGYVQAVNPAFTAQTGYGVEIAGQHTRVLYDEGRASESALSQALAAIGAGEPWRGELVVRRKEGTTFDADVSIGPIRDEAGRVTGFVGSLRDITRHKELERLKDEFVANVSHELRTPITSLKLYHDLLASQPEKREAYLARLKRETERLELIVEDLLRLSRMDQGQVTLTLSSVDLSALAGLYVTDRQPLAKRRGLTLTLDQQAHLPTVQADQGLLGQAVSILLTNALNYTPTGGRVTVSTHSRQWEEKRWVGFSVSDTGPGIPPDEQPRLFQRFFRGKAGHESGAPGTGLGLAIVKEIVERHHGRVEVVSEGEPGKGATFSVWLPVFSEQ